MKFSACCYCFRKFKHTHTYDVRSLWDAHVAQLSANLYIHSSNLLTNSVLENLETPVLLYLYDMSTSLTVCAERTTCAFAEVQFQLISIDTLYDGFFSPRDVAWLFFRRAPGPTSGMWWTTWARYRRTAVRTFFYLFLAKRIRLRQNVPILSLPILAWRELDRREKEREKKTILNSYRLSAGPLATGSDLHMGRHPSVGDQSERRDLHREYLRLVASRRVRRRVSRDSQGNGAPHICRSGQGALQNSSRHRET